MKHRGLEQFAKETGFDGPGEQIGLVGGAQQAVESYGSRL